MRRTALTCAALVLLAYAAARGLTHDFQVWTAEGARRLEVALHPLPAPPIMMEGAGGPPRSLQRWLTVERGVTIVDFMYTRCTTLCVALGGAFQQMQAEIVRDESGEPTSGRVPLRLLSISFDPAHDDAAALARYADRLQADARVWRFTRVAELRDAQPLLAHYQVTVIPDGLGGYEHNAALLVLDAQGRLARVFDYTELDTTLAYARALAGRAAAP